MQRKLQKGIAFPTNRRFPSYVCAGDEKETYVGPLRIVATVVRDDDYHIDDDDCHNVALEGLSKEEIERTKKARESWFADQWFYCGIIVRVFFKERLLAQASLWGIECNYPNSDNSYLDEVANELLEESLREAIQQLEQIRIHELRSPSDEAREILLMIEKDYGIQEGE